MFILYADKNKLTVRKRVAVTSGSVNVYPVRFEFSPDWDGLQKTAVFRAGNGSVSLLLDESGETAIPWEVLQRPNLQLQAGIYGSLGEDVILPTVWVPLGIILQGTTPGENARPPTPEVWQQALEQGLAGKADAINYTETGELGLFSGKRLLSSVPLLGGGGGPSWGIGHGLKIVDGNLSVNAVDDFSGDNTLPMTAAGVQTTVGNIEAILATI